MEAVPPCTTPEAREQQVHFELNRQARFPEALTFAKLLRLALMREEAQFVAYNPFLVGARLQDFYQQIVRLLLLKTELQEIERLSDYLDANHSSDLIAKEILRPRAYSETAQNAIYYLAFEFNTGCKLYEQQIALIDEMALKKTGTIYRLIMGAGKTSTITPLLSAIFADGDAFVMVVVPRPQLAEARELLSYRCHHAMHQAMDCLDLSTEKIETTEGLEQLRTRIYTIQENRGFLLCVPETIHDFILLLVETLERLAVQATPELQRRFTCLEDIVNFLMTKGVAILDEADLLLQRKKQRKFASGEFRPLDTSRFTLLQELYKILLQEPKLLLRQNRQLEFPVSEYKRLKFHVAEQLAERTLFGLTTAEKRRAFCTYVTDKSAELPDCLLDESALFCHKAALMKELLNVVLPLTLQHSSNEHYIFSAKQLDQFTAIPTLTTNKASEGSQFSHPYENYCSTIQHYLYERLSLMKVTRWISDLKTDGLKEYASRQAGKKITLSKTQAACFFKEKLAPHFGMKKGLFQVRDEELPLIMQEINRRDDAIFMFIERYVHPQIGFYESEISSNAYLLVECLQHVQGFSGTRPNRHSLPDGLEMQSRGEIDAKMLHLMTSGTKRAKLYASDAGNSARELLHNLQALELLKRHRVLIDAGGWVKFPGTTNQNFAEILLDICHPDCIEAVIFFSEVDDNKYLLKRGEKRAQRLTDDMPLNRAKVFAFFDKAHSIGADLKLDEKAEALITMSLDTPMSALFQGAGRLRNYAAQQRFDVVTSLEFQKRSPRFEIEELVYASMEVQTQQERSDNFIAAIEQLEAKLRVHCLQAILNATDPKVKIELWKECRHFFVKKRSDNCYEQYGKPDESMAPHAALAFAVQRLREECAKTKTLRKDLDAILKEFQAPPQSVLPETVYSKIDPSQGLQEEVREEVREEAKAETASNTSTKDCMQVTDRVDFAPLSFDEMLQKMHKKEVQRGFHLLSKKEPALHFFDENLIYPNSFEKRFEEQTSSFEPAQELADYVWIYQNKDDISVLLLTRDDAAVVQHGLAALTPSSQYKDVKQALYSMGTGRIYQNPAVKEQCFDADYMQNSELALLLGQVKLFNGDSDCTEEELHALNAWLEDGEADQEEVKKVFEERLLTRNREQIARYQGSKLQELLC